MNLDASALAESVGFELVGTELGSDVESALQAALAAGVVFREARSPLSIFREALATSIRAIDKNRRHQLFQKFLLKGPYSDAGLVPSKLVGPLLSDAEVGFVITFIYSHMVNCFKGAVAELLAAVAAMRLIEQLKQEGEIPGEARLYVGDTVGVHRRSGEGILKGADLYIIIQNNRPDAAPSIIIAGVGEVKSYYRSERRLREQLDQHLNRSRNGLRVVGDDYPSERISVGFGSSRRVVRISILPSSWNLPRSFRFETNELGRLLHVDPGVPHRRDDEITRIGDDEWRIKLRWSKEALSEAAYMMTFWYMEKVGTVVFSRSRPKEWEKMNPADAGRNAAKMMLYYAIPLCRTARESQRAIALYNIYGFGYALGMNFKNAEGRCEMLWPQDLDEILSAGKTESGCSIR